MDICIPVIIVITLVGFCPLLIKLFDYFEDRKWKKFEKHPKFEDYKFFDEECMRLGEQTWKNEEEQKRHRKTITENKKLLSLLPSNEYEIVTELKREIVLARRAFAKAYTEGKILEEKRYDSLDARRELEIEIGMRKES